MFSWDGFSALRWLVLGLFSQQTMVLDLVKLEAFVIALQSQIRSLSCDILEKVLLFGFCNQFRLSVMTSVATYDKSYCFLRVSLHVTLTLENRNSVHYLISDY